MALSMMAGIPAGSKLFELFGQAENWPAGYGLFSPAGSELFGQAENWQVEKELAEVVEAAPKAPRNWSGPPKKAPQPREPKKKPKGGKPASKN